MTDTFTEVQFSMRRTLRSGDVFRVAGVRGRFVFDYASLSPSGEIIVSCKDTKRKMFRAFYAHKVRLLPRRRTNG